jgi:hypothetical protein
MFEKKVNAMPLPSDIQTTLTSDETMIQYGAILEGVLYLTSKRILFRDIDARHKIESIAYQDIISIDSTTSKRQIGWILIGIAILLVTFFAVFNFNVVLSDIAYILISLVSIIMIIVGFYKVPSYTLKIAGNRDIKLSARNINDFMYHIRRYRDRAFQ